MHGTSREAWSECLGILYIDILIWLNLAMSFNGKGEERLCGMQSFLNALASITAAPSDCGIRHPAYWIALRQDILTAFPKLQFM